MFPISALVPHQHIQIAPSTSLNISMLMLDYVDPPLVVDDVGVGTHTDSDFSSNVLGDVMDLDIADLSSTDDDLDDITACLFGCASDGNSSTTTSCTQDRTDEHPNTFNARGGGFEALRRITRRELIRELQLSSLQAVNSSGTFVDHASAQRRWRQTWRVMLDLHDVLFKCADDVDDGAAEDVLMQTDVNDGENVTHSGAVDTNSDGGGGGEWLTQSLRLTAFLRQILGTLAPPSGLAAVDEVLSTLAHGDATREWYESHYPNFSADMNAQKSMLHQMTEEILCTPTL